jgi:hypothetical protein
MRVDVQT